MTDAWTNADVLALDPTLVFHSWSAQGTLKPQVLAGGKGSHLWDEEGKQLLDFSSQLVNSNIGYGHPRVVAAIKEQADKIPMVDPKYANRARGEAAERILSIAPEGFKKIFFTNGGADAIENAIRLARLTTGRDKVLSTYRSYHGNTGAAIVATGDWRRMPNEYARGHVHFFGPYLYRSEFWATTPEQECERALQHLRRVIESEGPDTVAAVLLETIPGTAGIMPPPPGYLEGVRELTQKHGILMISDEVMAGFGRTGRWLALDDYDFTPDLITFAKGVNSGYVPAGGVMISEPIAKAFDECVFPGGLTYSGHPLAMAAIVATIDAMKDEKIVENAKMIGDEHIAPALQKLYDKHEVIGEVRGKGVFWAVELVTDRESREPVADAVVAKLRLDLIDRGLLPFTSNNRIHVVPPCIITPDEVAEGIAIIDEALTAAF